MQVAARQGDTLDLICWRELGVTSGRVVERSYELNRDLAESGSVLTEGTPVVLPDGVPETADIIPLVQLWD